MWHAATRVLRSGLWLAAVATGSVAMPWNEPEPSVGTDAQPAPNGLAMPPLPEDPEELVAVSVGVVDEDDDEGAEDEDEGAEDEDEAEEGAAGAAGAAVPLPLEPQAARPMGSAAAKATSAVLPRMFMGCGSLESLGR